MKKSPSNGARALRALDAGRHAGCNIVQWRVYWVVGEEHQQRRKKNGSNAGNEAQRSSFRVGE